MFSTGNTRTAICFSGQPRTWRKCVDSWKEYLLTDEVDVFCHIWDFNTVPNSLIVGKDPVNVPVSQDEIDELLDILKPKKVLIESEKIFSVAISQPVKQQSYLSQYYGICRSAIMKKDYEIENDFMYNRVIRMRYDGFLTHDMKETLHKPMPLQTMECFHFGWIANRNIGRVGDIFWQADSRTHDLIADYYMNLPFIKPKYFAEDVLPENIWFHYIKKNNINLNVNHWDIKLFRESQELSFTKAKDGFETW